MELYVDTPWLLEIQAEVLPKELAVDDYSALRAAISRHQESQPRLGYVPDAAWRAAALLETLALLHPLPVRSAFFAAMVVVRYMGDSGEGIDAPYGALSDLVTDVRARRTDVYDTADRIRSWRI
ncbi:toxin Doc [Streptomyces sp. NPDC102402]|uniref:toxin Doc n=1 Tax=Streptomyces sp. NPDC102402 TaxID=3366169 RepID=UPI003812116C